MSLHNYTAFPSLASSASVSSGSQMENQSQKIICGLVCLQGSLYIYIYSVNYHFIGKRPKLKDVFRELFPLAIDWKNIGTLLGIQTDVLNRISGDEGRVSDCLREMLSEWLKQTDPPPTWAALADAVETINELKAQDIRARCVDISCEVDNGVSCSVHEASSTNNGQPAGPQTRSQASPPTNFPTQVYKFTGAWPSIISRYMVYIYCNSCSMLYSNTIIQ